MRVLSLRPVPDCNIAPLLPRKEHKTQHLRSHSGGGRITEGISDVSGLPPLVRVLQHNAERGVRSAARALRPSTAISTEPLTWAISCILPSAQISITRHTQSFCQFMEHFKQSKVSPQLSLPAMFSPTIPTTNFLCPDRSSSYGAGMDAGLSMCWRRQSVSLRSWHP